jgi:acyl-CoA thioester hydrolase
MQSDSATTRAATSALNTARADAFRWTLRVYYEDTDTGGIVYYANFLKFFERCRTEWLRALGVDQATLAAEHGLQFVVVSAAVQYIRPARLDDELRVSARIAKRGRASLEFVQEAHRGDELLATAQVKVACVAATTLAPAAMPPHLQRALDRTDKHTT